MKNEIWFVAQLKDLFGANEIPIGTKAKQCNNGHMQEIIFMIKGNDKKIKIMLSN